MRIIAFVYILLGCCLFHVSGQAQTKKQADLAYKNTYYQAAAEQYEKLLVDRKGVKLKGDSAKREEMILRLADCYWQLRRFEPALFWYEQLSAGHILTPALQKRKKALYAMNGKGLLPISSRDSADWAVQPIALDDVQYREFSPLLIDSVLYWSSNVRKGEWRPRLNWDGYRFTHLLRSVDTFTTTANRRERMVWDTSAYLRKIARARLATQYTLADNEHLLKIKHSSKLAGRSRFEQLDVNDNLLTDFNQAHLSVSAATQKVYINVNKPYVYGPAKQRLATIAEGIWNNGRIDSLHVIDLVDSAVSALHPAIHPDGKMLVFSAIKEEGKGGYDLYRSRLDANGVWQTPEAIGVLNTSGNELFARFTPSGNLVFSSDGYAGYGGLDLFMAMPKADGFAAAKHLPYPVNSSYDDFGWTEYPNGVQGYFSSDRFGDDDIFKFSYAEKWNALTGKVKQLTPGLTNQDVPVQLYEIDADGQRKLVQESKTDQVGGYAFKVKPNHQYVVIAKDVDGSQKSLSATAPTQTDLALAEIQIGKLPVPEKQIEAMDSVDVSKVAPGQEISREDRLNGSVYAYEVKAWIAESIKVWMVHHAYNSTEIIKKDLSILPEVKRFLKEHPEYKIYIVSATDCKGSEQYNSKLSKSRSVFVKSKFEEAFQKQIKHYWVGKRNLLVPCEEQTYQKEAQQMNRYSYIILTKMGK